jgi:hypothetical protein
MLDNSIRGNPIVNAMDDLEGEERVAKLAEVRQFLITYINAVRGELDKVEDTAKSTTDFKEFDKLWFWMWDDLT